MNGIRLQKMLAIMCLGGMPFATVSSCDFGPGGGTFYMDRNVDGFGYDPGYVYYPSHGIDVVFEDVYYEDYYYDEYWYEEDYYY